MTHLKRFFRLFYSSLHWIPGISNHPGSFLPGLLVGFVTLLGLAIHVSAETYYVSPDGNDNWSGTRSTASAAEDDGPFRTLNRAVRAVQPGDTCYLREGVYRQKLRPARSGTAEQPITFKAYQDETPILTGADSLSEWQPAEGNLYVASMAWNLGDENQVFANGKPLLEARWPNNQGALMQPTRATVEKGSKDTIKDGDLPESARDWKGATLWCAGGKQWYCWSRTVTGYDAASNTLRFTEPRPGEMYKPQGGNPYVVIGARAALDAPGEWYYDADNQKLYLYPPGGKPPEALAIEAKRRRVVIDLSGRSHIKLVGLHFRAGTLVTNRQSHHLVLDRLRGKYLGHSYENDISGTGAVQIRGRHNTVQHCEFGYCSGSVMKVSGSDHVLFNNYIHHGDYAGKWQGTMSLSGRRQVFSYNTVTESGRDVISVGGLAQSIVEYNDLSDAGRLTYDLGLTYGHNNDFANTVIRYNHVHDNQAGHLAMGIYFDHLSQNVIVHHNLIWNIDRDPVRFNNPGYFNLVYQNTAYNTGRTTTFDWSDRHDLFGTHYQNNIMTPSINLPDNVTFNHNLVTDNPPLRAPKKRDFRLTDANKAIDAGARLPGVNDDYTGQAPDIGAIEKGKMVWDAGHDFENHPPEPELYERPRIAWMNMVRNAAFEYGTIESWQKTGAGHAKIVDGNGWGNTRVGADENLPTGTSAHEMRLGPEADGLRQTVTKLNPDTRYTLSAWIRTSGDGVSAVLGVRQNDKAVQTVETSGSDWQRKKVTFKTDEGQRRCTIVIRKTGDGAGHVWADNFGLPLTPQGP